MKKLYVVGIGPGNADGLTHAATTALSQSDMLFGYTVYIELVAPLFPEKQLISTPMKSEKERCLLALQAADGNRTVSVVCSGDAGVYGMASLIYELANAFPQVEIEVVAGVTAALSGSALLGAPLSHDFAVVSLSDLLTPWEQIERRLTFAAQGDFALCLYNPASRKRQDYLQKACDILLRFKDPETVCGTVRNIGREGQNHTILTLEQLRQTKADMFTTVFVGNSQTKRINGKMVTPRGYKDV